MPETDALIRTTRIEVDQVSTSEFETLARVVEALSLSGAGFPQIENLQNPQQLIARVSKTLLAARVRSAKEKAVFIISSDNSAAIDVVSQVLEWLPRIIRARQQERLQDQLAKFVDLILPRDPAEDLARGIEADNAILRRQFMREWPSLTSKQVHELSGNDAKNTALTASRWKRQGRVFAVPFGNADRYPEFQFREGQPKPVISRVLKEFGNKRSPWQIAFWFIAENGWLDGRRPVDLLDTEAESVVEAARQEMDETVF
jgi:hypothetical protein